MLSGFLPPEDLFIRLVAAFCIWFQPWGSQADKTQKLSFLDGMADSTSSFLLLSLLARRPGYDRASVPQEGENLGHCSWGRDPWRIWGRLWHLWCLVLQWQGISVCLTLEVKYKRNRWEWNLRLGVTKFFHKGCRELLNKNLELVAVKQSSLPFLGNFYVFERFFSVLS